MKKELFAIIVLTAFSMPAMATKPKEPDPDPMPNTQEQRQEQAQSLHSKNDANAAAKSKSISESEAIASSDNNVDVDVKGDHYEFSSASSYAPPSFSNMRCDSTLGLSFTNRDGSGSAGIPVPRWLSKKIQDCEANADANWLAEAGLISAAVKARCSTRSMQRIFGKKTDQCESALKAEIASNNKARDLQSQVDRLRERNLALHERWQRSKDESDSRLTSCEVAQSRAHNAWLDCQKGK